MVTVALLLSAAGAWWLWPAALGGEASYVVTEGVSMAPNLNSGDLAIVRPAAHYAVGDLVAYRSQSLRVIVLHRVQAVRDGRLVMRGDHNSWFDPDEVAFGDVVGRLAVRVPHVGQVLSAGARPYLLIGGGALVALGRAGATRRRRSGRTPRRERRGAGAGTCSALVLPGSGIARVLPGVVTGTACTSAALLSMGALAWILPTTRSRPETIPYSQAAGMSYTANTPVGPAFPTGRAVTGDPVFLALSRSIDVTVDYRASASEHHSFGGTRAVVAVLSAANGWTRSIPLLPTEAFEGDAFQTRAHVDLTQFPQLIHEVELATKVPIPGYTLTVRTDISLTGSVADQPVSQSLTGSLSFGVDDRQARLASSGSGTRRPGDPVVAQAAGSVRRPGTVPTTLGLLGRTIPIAPLRLWLSVTGTVLLGLCALLLGVARLSARADKIGSRLNRYRQHVLRTEPVEPAAGRTIIDVDSIDELARVAERYERFILHSEADHRHDFLVDDGAALYRYQTEDSHPSEGCSPRSAPQPERPEERTITCSTTLLPVDAGEGSAAAAPWPRLLAPEPSSPVQSPLPSPSSPWPEPARPAQSPRPAHFPDAGSRVETFVDALRRRNTTDKPLLPEQRSGRASRRPGQASDS